MNLRAAAHALGGEIYQGDSILCPGPGHSRGDRSLRVWINDNEIRTHSFAGDDWRDCDEHVRKALGMAAWQSTRDRPVYKTRPKKIVPDTSQEWKRDRAREIFSETIDIRGTLGESYLSGERGMPNGIVDDALALTLRYHPRCPYGDNGQTHPAIVCAVRDLYVVFARAQKLGELGEVEREILSDISLVQAVHRIAITPDGKKIGRKAYGPIKGGVVLCSSLWESFYSSEAVAAEGVETALAMRALGFKCAMSLVSTSNFDLVWPHHIDTVVVSGERDETGASERAWRKGGELWSAAGKTVKIWRPPGSHNDANDYYRAQGALA